MGSVYVPVDVANAGIMPMDASGGGGQTGGGYWINWIILDMKVMVGFGISQITI